MTASPENAPVSFQNDLCFDTRKGGILRISPGDDAELFLNINVAIGHMRILTWRKTIEVRAIRFFPGNQPTLFDFKKGQPSNFHIQVEIQ
jgi:hypothetical protein